MWTHHDILNQKLQFKCQNVTIFRYDRKIINNKKKSEIIHKHEKKNHKVVWRKSVSLVGRPSSCYLCILGLLDHILPLYVSV